MRINNNIMALNTHRQYTINTNSVAKSTEKLSSGYRINRAGDDAAGLAISEKMRAQIRGLTMASKNSSDAISLIQTAEGALQETHNILQRMRELAVQSASDTNETTIDRDALNKEFQALIAEIDDTANKTRFNEMGVIDGSYQAVSKDILSSSGIADSMKVAFAKATQSGSYNMKAEFVAQGAQPVAGSGKIAVADVSDYQSSKVIKNATIDFTDSTTGISDLFGAATDGGNMTFSATAATVDGVTTVTVTAIANDGTDDTGTFAASFILDNAGGDQNVTLNLGDGNGASGINLSFTVKQGATAANVAAGFAADIGDGAGVVDTDPDNVTISGSLSITSSDLFNLDSLTGSKLEGLLLNGGYAMTAAYDNTDDSLVFTLTPTTGGGATVVSAKVDISSLVVAGGDKATFKVDFGDDYGVMDFTLDTTATSDPTVVADIRTDLGTWAAALGTGGEEITFANGADPKTEIVPAYAKITVTNADGSTETIKLEAGMSGYKTQSGLEIDFGKKLTAGDLSNANSLQQFLGGTLLSSVTIGEKDGTAFVIQTGANKGDELVINIDRMDSWNLGIDKSNVADRASASNAIKEVNDAINQVSTQRAALGALQNRLQHKINNLDTSAENLAAAESRIRDLDMAKEMTNFTRNNILVQASTAMLAQANAAPQGVLQLLQ